MSEKKRYTYIDVSNNGTIGSFFCNGVHLSNQKVVELLNENERLKRKNNAYLQDIEVFKEENTVLRLENERLRQNKEVKE